MSNLHRHYYAAHSYMGLNYTYDSPCWVVYAFDTLQERDQWVREHEYSQDTGNYVAKAVSARVALQIAPDLRTKSLHARTDNPLRVRHL